MNAGHLRKLLTPHHPARTNRHAATEETLALLAAPHSAPTAMREPAPNRKGTHGYVHSGCSIERKASYALAKDRHKDRHQCRQ